jgi:DNA-binding transcriptional LysR family regulator
VPLLERVGKRAFPTRAGEVLLTNAARAFRELQAGIEHVQELRGVLAGRVRLGTSASISVYLLPRALGRFRARFPAVDLDHGQGLRRCARPRRERSGRRVGDPAVA